MLAATEQKSPRCSKKCLHCLLTTRDVTTVSITSCATSAAPSSNCGSINHYLCVGLTVIRSTATADRPSTMALVLAATMRAAWLFARPRCLMWSLKMERTVLNLIRRNSMPVPRLGCRVGWCLLLLQLVLQLAGSFLLDKTVQIFQHCGDAKNLSNIYVMRVWVTFRGFLYKY